MYLFIKKTTPIQYHGTFYGCKNEKFQMIKCCFFVILFFFFARNRDCGYSLEPPHQCGSNGRRIDAVLTGTHNLCFIAEIRKIMYTLANPIFFYIKVGFEGSKLHRHVFRDMSVHTFWCIQ